MAYALFEWNIEIIRLVILAKITLTSTSLSLPHTAIVEAEVYVG